MTIQEIRNKKTELEKEVFKLVNKFENETDTKVNTIYISRYNSEKSLLTDRVIPSISIDLKIE